MVVGCALGDGLLSKHSMIQSDKDHRREQTSEFVDLI